jgi:hypothetical protein
MMPVSRKGRAQKATARSPLPIPAALAARLRKAAVGRRLSDPLLLKASGDRWRRNNQRRYVQRVVRAAGLDPREITLYALRHSSIVRRLLANIPIRIVAVSHDTSVTMIERTYSRYIDDHTDALVRRILLDRSQPSDQVVVPLIPRKPARR